MKNKLKKIISSLMLTGVIASPFISSVAFSAPINHCINHLNQLVDSGYLNLTACGLGDSDVPALLAYLAKNADVTSLSIDRDHISQDAASQIVDYVAHSKTITGFDLAAEAISHQSIMALAKNNVLKAVFLHIPTLDDKDAWAFTFNKSINYLVLSQGKISDRGAIMLAHNRHLKVLGLRANQISTTGAIALSRAKQLMGLSLSENPIDDNGIKAIASNGNLLALELSHVSAKAMQAIADNTHLQYLHIYDSVQLGDEQALALAKNTNLAALAWMHNGKANQLGISARATAAFAALPNLKVLELTGTMIDDAALSALAKTKSITVLGIGGVCHDQYSDKAISDLGLNNSIQHLRIAGKVGVNGVRALAHNHSITSLALTSAEVTADGIKALVANEKLIDLDLTNNHLTDMAALIIAKSKTISKLNLAQNNLSETAAFALGNNKTLIHLNLDNNHIGDRGAIALARTTTLQKLMVHKNNINAKGYNELVANKYIYVLGIDNQSATATQTMPANVEQVVPYSLIKSLFINQVILPTNHESLS
jgi:hypothetical protein